MIGYLNWLGWIISLVLITIGGILIFKIEKIAHNWLDNHYKERVSYFEELNKGLKPGSIVFLGDSITEHFLVSEIFPDYYTVNRGISGDTTEGVLNRMQESVYDLRPSKIFLMIGTNDLGKKKKINVIINRIETIIMNIKKNLPDTEIFLESVYPVRREWSKQISRKMVGARNNEDIRMINEGIKIIAHKYNVTYIDIYSLLKDENEEIKLEYTKEGLHLTPMGYRVVANEIKKYL